MAHSRNGDAGPLAAGVAFSGHGLLGAIFALLIGLNTGALVLVRR